MTLKLKRELSWTPRRRGRIYCAPACGRGCTKAEHDAALAKARKLAERLGEGWEPILRENLGWFYRARKGNVDVHENVNLNHSYTAYITEGDGGSGGVWVGSGSTPRAAIEAALATARIEVEHKLSLFAAAAVCTAQVPR